MRTVKTITVKMKYFNQTKTKTVEAFKTLQDWKNWLHNYKDSKGRYPIIATATYKGTGRFKTVNGQKVEIKAKDKLLFKHMIKTMPAINPTGRSLFKANNIDFEYDPVRKTYAIRFKDLYKLGLTNHDMKKLVFPTKKIYVQYSFTEDRNKTWMNTQQKEWLVKFIDAWRNNKL